MSGTGTKRILAIDACRGMAILLMCVAHIAQVASGLDPAVSRVVNSASFLATPIFLLLSGISTGYVLRTEASPLSRIRLVDRAVFLLLVVHPLISACMVPYDNQGWARAMLSTWVTDAVALALCIAAFVPRAGARALISSGVVLTTSGWLIAQWWKPESSLTESLARLIFRGGGSLPSPLGFTVPLLPYIGIFLIGFGVARAYRPFLEGRLRKHLPLVVGMGLAAMSGLMLMKGLLRMAKGELSADQYGLLFLAIDPRMKDLAAPGYVIFGSGAVAVMLSTCLWCQATNRFERAFQWLATLGRASMVVFVLQAFTILCLPRILHFHSISSGAFWTVYLLINVGMLWLAARAWGGCGGNRWLTVGMPHWAEKYASHEPVGDGRSAFRRAGA